MLTNVYFVAIGIPIILLMAGALAKKLVRGSKWRPEDFFLGVEFTLSAMSAELVYIFDLAKDISRANKDGYAPPNEKLVAIGAFIAITFFLMLLVLSIYQDWEDRTDRPRARFIWLGILTNLVGAGLIAGFILLVKGAK